MIIHIHGFYELFKNQQNEDFRAKRKKWKNKHVEYTYIFTTMERHGHHTL